MQNVVDARVGLSAATLHRITGDILSALEALDTHASHAHGALTPGNVLLAGSGPIHKSHILLTDPAPDGPALKNDEAARIADNHALMYLPRQMRNCDKQMRNLG